MKYILFFLLFGCSVIAEPLSEKPGASKSTLLDETPWLMYQHPIAEPTRYSPTVKSTSYASSKVYSGSFVETDSEYQLYCVGDNNTASGKYHWDQTFLKYKSKTDGLPFYEGWQWYQDVNGEPIPVLQFDQPDMLGTSIQNWLGTPTVMPDGSLHAYYSVNVGTIQARYSMGKAVSTDNGRTWVRHATNITAQGGGENHYQFQQGFYDVDLDKWIVLSPNFGPGVTQGRACTLRVYHSTDGIVGENFVKVSNDIYAGTQIDVGGFVFTSKPWKENGTYYWYANAGELPNYKSQPDTNPALTVYPYLEKQIVLVSGDLSVANPTLTIEKVVFETDQQGVLSVFPCSNKIIHDDKEYMFVNTMNWRIESAGQTSIDVRLISTTPPAGTVVDNNVYPSYVHRFYKMHQSHLDDTYQSTTVYPKEIIANDSAWTTGTLTQYNFNRVYTPNGTVGFKSFTHDKRYFALKFVGDIGTQLSPNNLNRGLIEKKGTFTAQWAQSARFEVVIYCENGSKKQYRTNLTTVNYGSNLFKPLYFQPMFSVTRNASDTDMDLKLYVDYTECAVIKVQDQVCDNLVQNDEPIIFGAADNLVNQNKSLGSAIILSGQENVTKDNLLNSSLF